MFRKVKADNKEITYELEKKQVKNYNLRVRSDGSVHLSVPGGVSVQAADMFVIKNADFVFKAQEKYAKREIADPLIIEYLGKSLQIKILYSENDRIEISKDYFVIIMPTIVAEMDKNEQDSLINAYINTWKTMKAKEIFSDLLVKEYDKFTAAGIHIPYPRFTVRDMKSRWGSCAFNKKKITLNSNLLEKPIICIEYVICHELAHFVQQNHSAEFYKVLDKVMPNHREIRNLLNEK